MMYAISLLYVYLHTSYKDTSYIHQDKDKRCFQQKLQTEMKTLTYCQHILAHVRVFELIQDESSNTSELLGCAY
jgi:hypothetical protein